MFLREKADVMTTNTLALCACGCVVMVDSGQSDFR